MGMVAVWALRRITLKRLRLPAREAPWLADYLHEPITFPNSKYDDLADSTSQALAWINQSRFEAPYAMLPRRSRRSAGVVGRRGQSGLARALRRVRRPGRLRLT